MRKQRRRSWLWFAFLALAIALPLGTGVAFYRVQQLHDRVEQCVRTLTAELEAAATQPRQPLRGTATTGDAWPDYERAAARHAEGAPLPELQALVAAGAQRERASFRRGLDGESLLTEHRDVLEIHALGEALAQRRDASLDDLLAVATLGRDLAAQPTLVQYMAGHALVDLVLDVVVARLEQSAVDPATRRQLGAALVRLDAAMPTAAHAFRAEACYAAQVLDAAPQLAHTGMSPRGDESLGRRVVHSLFGVHAADQVQRAIATAIDSTAAPWPTARADLQAVSGQLRSSINPLTRTLAQSNTGMMQAARGIRTRLRLLCQALRGVDDLPPLNLSGAFAHDPILVVHTDGRVEASCDDAEGQRMALSLPRAR